MAERGYRGGGSAAEARPPQRLPSGARRVGQVAPDRSVPPKATPAHVHTDACPAMVCSCTNPRPADPYGLRQVVGTGGPNTSTQNRRGEWVPAIPLPLYSRWRKRCGCGARFWTSRGYRGHYALEHILGQE